MSSFTDAAEKFVYKLRIPKNGDWSRIHSRAARCNFHITLFYGTVLIYDNILFPYMDAITYNDFKKFYPQYARNILSSRQKVFSFHEAGKQVDTYFVSPLRKEKDVVAIIGTDLCSSSRLNSLLRVFLFTYGIRTQNPRLTADQSSLEGVVYSPAGGPPTIGRENIYLSYRGYVESGYDASADAIVRTFSYDATNQTISLEWTWKAVFGPNGPQPDLAYSQDDAVIIKLDCCGYWRYIREYFNLNQLVSSFGPGGPKSCVCE